MNADDALVEKCPHPKAESRLRTIKGDRQVIALQCLTCGVALKHVSFSEHPDLKALKTFDQPLKDDYDRRHSLARRERAAEERRKFEEEYHVKTGPFWGPYLEYLQSDHWADVRRAVLRRDPFCQKCLSSRSEQAHHLSYETFKKHGFSFAHECVGICVGCHKSIHPESGI